MKIYVGNLSFHTGAEDLQEVFGRHGNVVAVDLISDRETGRSRGFAFVTMSSRAEGEAAINALQGQELDGRALTVNEARPKEDRFGGLRPARSFSRAGR